jgi:hypothetical protein
MLGLVKRDTDGKIRYGHLFLSDPVVRENWMRRLKSAGFDYLFTYSDVQGRCSLAFARY